MASQLGSSRSGKEDRNAIGRVLGFGAEPCARVEGEGGTAPDRELLVAHVRAAETVDRDDALDAHEAGHAEQPARGRAAELCEMEPVLAPTLLLLAAADGAMRAPAQRSLRTEVHVHPVAGSVRDAI